MSFTPFPTLTTNRLILRKPTKADGNEILFLRSDPTVNQYINRPTPDNLKAAEDFVEKINQGHQKRQNIYWNISLKTNPVMIGSICLWNFSTDGKRGEVGYDLHPEFQGKGIMSEALQCVVEFGFKKLNLETIEAFTHRENEASIKLLKKNDFVKIPDKQDEYNKYNVVFELKRSQVDSAK